MDIVLIDANGVNPDGDGAELLPDHAKRMEAVCRNLEMDGVGKDNQRWARRHLVAPDIGQCGEFRSVGETTNAKAVCERHDKCMLAGRSSIKIKQSN